MDRSDSSQDEQINDDGSDGDDGDDENSDNNEDSVNNDNENNEEKKHSRVKRRKLKRKKLSRYFDDESAQIEIKTDRMINDEHKYKVTFTKGEKQITRWISEKTMHEKAQEVLDKYNSRPKKIKKKKIKRYIHKQPKPIDESNDIKDEPVGNEDSIKPVIPLINYQSFQFSSKTEKKPKMPVLKNPEDDNKTLNQVKDQTSNKSQANRQIKEVFGMKKREKSNFPDFIVKFTDSNRLERVTWKKMHEQYKSNLLNFYEQNIPDEGFCFTTELPDGLQLEEKLHFLQYS